MKKVWDVKIRESIKKGFPQDPMMQELHEIRARISKRYKSVRKAKEPGKKIHQPFFETINVR